MIQVNPPANIEELSSLEVADVDERLAEEELAALTIFSSEMARAPAFSKLPGSTILRRFSADSAERKTVVEQGEPGATERHLEPDAGVVIFRQFDHRGDQLGVIVQQRFRQPGRMFPHGGVSIFQGQDHRWCGQRSQPVQRPQGVNPSERVSGLFRQFAECRNHAGVLSLPQQPLSRLPMPHVR